MFSAMHLGGLFILKSAKNLQEGLQKHKNKIGETVTSIIQNLTQSIPWGTRR